MTATNSSYTNGKFHLVYPAEDKKLKCPISARSARLTPYNTIASTTASNMGVAMGVAAPAPTLHNAYSTNISPFTSDEVKVLKTIIAKVKTMMVEAPTLEAAIDSVVDELKED